MYIGIDLGTSGVKVALMSEELELIATHIEHLDVSRPYPLWSEQKPEEWWIATNKCMLELSQKYDLSMVNAIGLSGQMHGATLLDEQGRPLRPAILWNDGRSEEECRLLEAEVPQSRIIGGNIMMPGFTAPKLKWVAHNEPLVFEKVHKVLLPKDYLRFKMTGDYASDLSDSAGTLWLNVEQRDWSEELLSATGLTRTQMPELYEGDQITGYLTDEVSRNWGMSKTPVIAGGGDNAAGAIGVGLVKPGQAMLSLGTSGVYFAVSEGYVSNPESALHSFCHALPNTWHTMSVILSAASCLDWVQKLTGFDSVSAMLEETQPYLESGTDVIFLPYLSGERTPYNDPNAKGVFFGMTHSTTKYDLVLSVLEGVGFAFADGFDALHVLNQVPEEISIIGGGARCQYWRQMLADIVGKKLVYRDGGEIGPALGAARLAKLGINPELNIDSVCPVPELIETHNPNMAKHEVFSIKREKFQQLYTQLKTLF